MLSNMFMLAQNNRQERLTLFKVEESRNSLEGRTYICFLVFLNFGGDDNGFSVVLFQKVPFKIIMKAHQDDSVYKGTILGD